MSETQTPTPNASVFHEAAGNLSFLMSCIRCGEKLSEAEERCVRRVIARLGEAERRYRWRPISEIHEDYGPCVLINIADTGYLEIGNNRDLDWDESLWTHFSQIAPMGQEEYERMKAEVELAPKGEPDEQDD